MEQKVVGDLRLEDEDYWEMKLRNFSQKNDS